MLNINPIILARVAPFAVYILMMIMTSFVSDDVIDTRWLYGLRIIGAGWLLFYFWHRFDELSPLSELVPSKILLSIVTGITVFILWINLNQDWMLIGEQTSYNPNNQHGQLNLPMIAMRIFGAMLVVPIIEELFWRSFIMRWIDEVHFDKLAPAIVSFRAFFISSLIFAVEHSFWFAGLLAGLIYGLLYMRTQQLWYAIIAHAVTNGILGCWVIYSQQWHYW